MYNVWSGQCAVLLADGADCGKCDYLARGRLGEREGQLRELRSGTRHVLYFYDDLQMYCSKYWVLCSFEKEENKKLFTSYGCKTKGQWHSKILNSLESPDEHYTHLT